jgi:ABC-type transport system involved in multi-copper enzyme maturation permease subunit
VNTWSISLSGISTVLSLELKQRIRSKKTFIALGVWFVFMGGITWLISQFFDVERSISGGEPQLSRWLFAMITMFVMGMCLLVAPVFSASSIVSDREHGVLATLQATKLSAVEIAAGKLISSWLVSLAFVVATIPYIAYAVWLGGVTLWQVCVVTMVVFVEVALICTIGLGWSAIASRAIISTVFTYLSVAFMTIITLIIFAAATAMTQTYEQVSDWRLPDSVARRYTAELNTWFAEQHSDNAAPPAPPLNECVWVQRDYAYNVTHTEYTWWLLLLDPFVIVADATPTSSFRYDGMALADDPLTVIKLAVRSTRIGESAGEDRCGTAQWYGDYYVQPRADGTFAIQRYGPHGSESPSISEATIIPESPFGGYNIDDPVWPWGMASNLLIAAVFFRLAVKRLAVPYGVLPTGQRVA